MNEDVDEDEDDDDDDVVDDDDGDNHEDDDDLEADDLDDDDHDVSQTPCQQPIFCSVGCPKVYALPGTRLSLKKIMPLSPAKLSLRRPTAPPQQFLFLQEAAWPFGTG